MATAVGVVAARCRTISYRCAYACRGAFGPRTVEVAANGGLLMSSSRLLGAVEETGQPSDIGPLFDLKCADVFCLRHVQRLHSLPVRRCYAPTMPARHCSVRLTMDHQQGHSVLP